MVFTAIALLCLVGFLFASIQYQRTVRLRLQERITTVSTGVKPNKVDFAEFTQLPAPVQHYFRTVLRDGKARIQHLQMNQSGSIKINYQTDSWSAFTARQTVAAIGDPRFCWNAKIAMPMGLHMRVLDNFNKGVGSGRLVLQSAVTVAKDSNNEFINAAALQRYLAESVWYPSALLPGNGVTWTAIDDSRALATLTVAGLTVSIEFRFNAEGEVTSIFTPCRFRKVKDGYEATAWEGHFSNYQEKSGMRVPICGEVGWYIDNALQLVWKGEILNINYSFVS